MKKIIMLLAVALVMFLALPAMASYEEGVDCGKDPVYEKNFNAKAKISSRLRDYACMTGSTVIRVINQGEVVKVTAYTDGWYKVKDSKGNEGWVGSTLLEATDGEYSESSSTKDDSTSTAIPNVKGYILLQVEKHGEAWYVNPENSYRYYMKDGSAAYSIMREMGLGISNANLNKLKAGDKKLLQTLKGKIVLQVEENGEAYYINPKDGSINYLKDGNAAYNVMKKLSLGITNSNLNKIKESTIDKYKAAKKVVEKETYKNENTTFDNSDGSIILKGSVNDSGVVSLSWSLSQMISSMGFKVVVSKNENPVYPGNDYHYLSDKNTRTDSWNDLSAGTYYFRVCEYLGGKCGIYSNNLKLTIPETSVSNSEGSIALTGSVNEEGIAILNWSLKDMTSNMGFKVVVSKNENPVYPGNDYHYLSDKNTRTDSWNDLSAGTYYFRVCEYLGGKCGIYSNNLKLEI